MSKKIEIPIVPFPFDFSGLDEALEKMEQLSRMSKEVQLVRTPAEDHLYTVAEVATIFKTNANTVYKLIDKGLLTCLKLGSFKIRKKEVESFLERMEGMDLTDLENIKSIETHRR